MDEARARELLAGARKRIEAQLAGHTTQEDVDPSIDQGDEGADLTARDVDDALADQLREELEAIERAEQRLAEGTYGISVESGKPIPDGRLEAIPWADRTADEDEPGG
jgi:RNA polymerase-binding transcription factor